MRTAAGRGGPREQVNTVCETTEGRPGLTRGRTQFWGRLTKGEREREKRRARELKGGECMRREEGVKEKEKRIRDGSAG